MSGPMAAGFGLEAAVLVSAQAILQGAAEIAGGLGEAEHAAEERRQQRRAERQQMRAARVAGQVQQQHDIEARDQLARLTRLAGADHAVDPAAARLDARMTALLASEEKAQEELAAAIVLEQSLKDLGYAVEDIAETLFIEGGVAHFQRPEWGDYFVRLRIDPKRRAMNFNVVRAGVKTEDRKHEDRLAEERWCSTFPKLFETLEARGIPITVTRLLQAGEAPVQVVDATSLPQRASEERRRQPLKVRSME